MRTLGQSGGKDGHSVTIAATGPDLWDCTIGTSVASLDPLRQPVASPVAGAGIRCMAGAKVFISYCHEDGEFLERLRRHLGLLESQFAVEIWDDRRIGTGENWRQSIETAISSSDLYVCLISVDFFASEFIRDHEIPVILKAVENGKPLLPIRVGPLGVDGHPFCRLQSLNEPNRPLISMTKAEQESFFAEATKTMQEALQSIVNTPAFEGTTAVATTEPMGEERMAEEKTGHLKVADESSSGAYNIAVIGQAGVGKSELFNYLFGQPIRTTGVGKPVTEPGFHKVSFELNGMQGNLFDSAGLEVGKHEEWQKELDEELRNRGTDQPADQWFHTVLFCVSASEGRIQPFESNIIRKFLEQKYQVIVVLTKSDRATVAERAKLRSDIVDEISNGITCVEVASKEVELESGRTRRFGADRLLEHMLPCFWDAIAHRLPGRCIFRISNELDSWSKRAEGYLEKETGWFNHEAVSTFIQKDFEKYHQQLFSSGGRLENIFLEEIKIIENICKTFNGFLFLCESKNNEINIKNPNHVLSAAKAISDALSFLGPLVLNVGYGFISAVTGAGFSMPLLFPVILPVAAVIGTFSLVQRKNNFKSDMRAIVKDSVQQTKEVLHQMEPELTRLLQENIVEALHSSGLLLPASKTDVRIPG